MLLVRDVRIGHEGIMKYGGIKSKSVQNRFEAWCSCLLFVVYIIKHIRRKQRLHLSVSPAVRLPKRQSIHISRQ